VITPVAGPAPSPTACEGAMVYTFTYTDCSGNSHDWNYTYTIDIPDFVLPADGSSTVSCPADAVVPVTPVVTDACGNTITPVAGPAPSPTACEGAMIYTFTYTDCSGNSHVWNYTYTIDIPDFVLPADGSSTVSCPADATAPTPPSVTDACGNVITPVAGPAPSPTACEGAMVYTFTYTDCSGNSHDWNYTYTIDLIPPTVTCPPNQILCVEPDNNYILSPLVASGNCSGIIISYQISGATTRSGNGADASGSFGIGSSTITWTVTDDCGTNEVTCTTTITISSPTDVEIVPTDATCGVNNGTITIGIVSGGVPPYSYSINGSLFTNTISYTDLPAGAYTIQVMDANGCVYTEIANIANTTGPTDLALTPTNATCGFSNGSLEIGNATGGTPPYTYSVDNSPFTTNTSYPNLAPGPHSVVVKDANGCLYPTTINIADTPGPTATAIPPMQHVMVQQTEV
jgi:hypothetical protein